MHFVLSFSCCAGSSRSVADLFPTATQASTYISAKDFATQRIADRKCLVLPFVNVARGPSAATAFQRVAGQGREVALLKELLEEQEDRVPEDKACKFADPQH
jgi:hypothetical protein